MTPESDPPFGELAPGHRSGFVAMVGAPNAGKSTLLNRLLGSKIAIVTPKPQTTRRRILGIVTRPQAQILFVDTPGIHKARGLMNERMVARAVESLTRADVALWIVDAAEGLNEDAREVAAVLPAPPRAAIVALNKMDRRPNAHLLQVIAEIARVLPGREVVPISALTGENVDALLRAVEAALPEGPRYYPPDEITDEPERSVVAEIVREKVMLATRDEIPYSVAVTVDSFEERRKKRLVVIKATIHVARNSQKPIIIGKEGRRIKAIGAAARAEIERFLDARLFLELFVRVQEDWIKRAACLREFGV